MNTTTKDLSDPLDEPFGGASTGAPRPMARPALLDTSALGIGPICAERFGF